MILTENGKITIYFGRFLIAGNECKIFRLIVGIIKLHIEKDPEVIKIIFLLVYLAAINHSIK
jgi:hypothetical protein